MKKFIKFNRFASLVLAVMMFAFSFATLENADSIKAYAATLSKPVVTLTNTSSTSIKVSWKKVSSASKYTVYRSTSKSSGYKALATTTSTSYSNSKLTCGKTYYYKVKAINGKNSATSAVVSKKAAPAIVSNVSASATCTSVKVSWSKTNDVSGYQVYYSTSKSGSYKKLATVTSASYTNKSLSLKTTRYYKVRAYKKVGSNYVYGGFSSIVYKTTDHAASTSWTVTKKATCATTGTKTNKCKYCGKTYSVTIPKDDSNHNYGAAVEVPADNEYESYKVYTCTRCGSKYNTKIKKHKYSTVVTQPTCQSQGYTTYSCTDCDYTYVGDYTSQIPHTYESKTFEVTCTEDGYTANVCTVCGYIDESSKTDIVESRGTNHKYGEPQKNSSGYLVSVCSVCNKEKIDTTCYIDLTNQTVSVPAVAEFNISESNTSGEIDKLDLNPDGVSDYEITGNAQNITIDVNASCDVEIKLAGVTIANSTKDCIDIKNKSTDDSSPTVSVSIKDSTVNTLTTVESGNAIESSCELELKGHGTLNVDTASTSINCEAKLSIKNLTLDVKSKNRGIDTKYQPTDTDPEVYYNIKIGANANITINSLDDCIRCKNMEISALSDGDVDTVLDLKSTSGDGIQLEGNTGLTAYSGVIKIDAGKYAFRCTESKVNNVNGGATIIAKGASGIYKPEKNK
jgi:hypothetical protein